MGALTLKSFPFEIRGWDIEKFESIDPTDSFGSNTRVYINKDQIVQIEPDYNDHTFNTWLTDKGRQFFDGLFESQELTIKKKGWGKIFDSIVKTSYLFNHCNKLTNQDYFFTIVFENLSLESLNMLLLISNNYSFIKLRRAENLKINPDLESGFQLNNANNKIKLSSSTLCLLIANNPRYEGYYLNLNLRQRFLKGDFKCLTVGSLIDLTFPISFLGSNLKIIKSIIEGNSLTCQDLKFAKNPILIYNNELLKQNLGDNIIEMLKYLTYSNIFNKTWCGLDMLNSSLSDVGTHTTAKFTPLSLNDLNNASSFYFLNTNISNVLNIQKLIELKLLHYGINSQKEVEIKKLFLDQNSRYNNNSDFSLANLNEYHYLPNGTFYQNEETFINTEGLIKKTIKLIPNKKTKNNWQILKKILKHFKQNLTTLNRKDNEIVFFNSSKLSNFKNFNCFQYYAVKNLTSLSFYLNVKNVSTILNNKRFKIQTKKIINSKTKYWLDDFFTGGKDEYSSNSLILTNCSKILRSETTNFF